MIKKTINLLLIEDNPGDARLIHEFLKEARGVQFKLAHVEQLQAAHEFLLSETTDVLLLDLGLPDAKGFEALTAMREAMPELPVVVLTGLDDEKAGMQAVSLGAQDYLIKGQVDAALLTRVLRYAIERKQAEKATQASQQLAQSTIDSLNSNICVLDENGIIITINKSWTKFADDNGGASSNVGIGSNYLAVCDATKGSDRVYAQKFAHGLRTVMRGDSELFELEYPCHSHHEKRWFIERITPLLNSESGQRMVVIAHENITESINAQNTLRRQHQLLLSLQKTSLELVSQLDLDRLLQNIVRRAGELVGTTAGFLDLIDPDTNRLIPKVGLGVLADSPRIEVQPGQGLAGIVWQTGQPLMVHDYGKWPKRINNFEKEFIHSIVAVPLLANSNVMGVLGLAYEFPAESTFGPETIEVLNQFARLATVAIQNARLFDRLKLELVERKQAEDSLHLKSAALDAAANAIVITDIEGTIQWANPAFTALTHYTVTEAVGSTPRLLKSGMHDDLFHTEMWETILAGKIWHGELINQRKDGTLYTEEQTITPVINSDGDIDHFVSIKQDITERKRAEEDRVRLLTQVREQAIRIKQIMDTVPEGIILLDEYGRIMLTNPVAERDLLVLVGEKKNGTITHLGDRSLPELLKDSDWQEVNAAGRTFDIIARLMPDSFDAKNWVLVINDVTEQQATQRYQQAQERLATVGQLAAGIAHDFNNVMSVITLYAQLLQEIPGLSHKQMEKLTIIHQQAQHAAKLIAQILDFSRRSDMERKPLNILPLIREIIKLLECTLPENISLNLKFDRKVYSIQADPTQLQQAFMNLAFNARDAISGSGNLNFSLSAVVYTSQNSTPLPDMEPGEWLHIVISDTGAGIAPEHLSRVFDPFFTTKEVGKGTGLGLAQVYGIVKQHDGLIDVQSQIGKGTAFDIYFPLLTVPIPPTSPTMAKDSSQQGNEIILLVEDNVSTRLAVAEALTGLGYNVLSANEGHAALKILDNENDAVHLVITDLVMPGMDGAHLTQSIQQQYPKIKTLIMTGHSLDEERLQSLQKTEAPWIQKPFSIEQLSEKVRDIFDA